MKPGRGPPRSARFASAACLFFATKRAAEREAGRVVTTALVDTGPIDRADATFLAELSVTRLPTRDLSALYAGLVARVDALAAARAFRLAEGPEQLSHWRTTLTEIQALVVERTTLAAAMRKESRLAVRVELGEKSRQLKLRLDALQSLLK